MPTRLNQADQALALLKHARSATPFFSKDGQPCASVPADNESRRVVPIRSADFRDWLTANYYSEFETAPSSLALRAVLRTLEARAQFGDWPAQKVAHRVSFDGDPFVPTKIFLDLANTAGDLLEITSQGWTITNNLRQSFRHSPGMLPLPSPASHQPPTTSHQPLPSPASHQPPTTSHQSRPSPANHQPPTTSHQSLPSPASHQPPTTSHQSLPSPAKHQPPTTSHQPLPSPLANPQSPIPNPLLRLAALFNLSPTAHVLVLTWLTAALRATGPYPILVLRGPSACGKSVLARALRALIDPSAAPVRLLPARDRELLHLALYNWILVFDQVHRIPLKISEALCSLSSGEAIETAQPDYRDNTLAEIARPIILIAPFDEAQSPWTPTRSLSNRCLAIDLAPLAAPRSEAALWADFEVLREPALATLADAVSAALRHVRDVDLGQVARFHDCVAWTAGASSVLGLRPDAIVTAVSDLESMWLGVDPLRDTLYTLLRMNPTWSGDATALLTQLRALAPLATLPSTPKGLVQALARIPGITATSTQGSHGRRSLSILKTPEKMHQQTQKHP